LLNFESQTGKIAFVSYYNTTRGVNATLKYFSGTFVLSTIYAKFANIDYCIAEQMGNFFHG